MNFRWAMPMGKVHTEDCGIRGGKQLKAVIPGGSSVYITNAEQVFTKRRDNGLRGTCRGRIDGRVGGFIVMDETVDVMESTKNLSNFISTSPRAVKVY
ncbi:MAG: hypothetical protein IPQ00_17990 [Chloracidobacterium sp.]|nr:hypothetical protein [Chloracidobacterium sp.]